MSRRGIAALQAGLLLWAIFFWAILANAAVLKNAMRITVLDSVTRASTPDDNNGVPKNCEQLTFDAYCRSTTSVPMVSTLLVQVGNDPPFRISCTIDSKYSRCTPLPKGETFDAKREKHGITVYFVDDKGKLRRQLYTYVEGEPGAAKSATTAINSASATSTASAAAAPTAGATTPAAGAPPTASATQSASGVQGTVKCSFSSTPAGAEITLDGQYVGSTPSVMSVGTGAHTVQILLPGYAVWKRDLTVSPGSELTVNAVLEKTR